MKRVVPEDQKRGEGTGCVGRAGGCREEEDVKEEPDTRTSDRLPVHVQVNVPMQTINLISSLTNGAR